MLHFLYRENVLGLSLCNTYLFGWFSFAVATPKQIRELMQVDGLTNDEVKSHLQVGIHISWPVFSSFIPYKFPSYFLFKVIYLDIVPMTEI